MYKFIFKYFFIFIYYLKIIGKYFFQYFFFIYYLQYNIYHIHDGLAQFTRCGKLLSSSIIYLFFRINITCEGEVSALHLYQNRSMIPIDRTKRHSQYMFVNRKRRSADENGEHNMIIINT